jgi:predicted RNase H-like HicB family nuclease
VQFVVYSGMREGMKITSIKFRVRLVVEPDGDEFHVYCPELKGLHMSGASEKEALQNGKEAAIAYINSIISHDDPLPLCAVKTEESFTVGELLNQLAGKAFGGLFRRKPAHSYVTDLCLSP